MRYYYILLILLHNTLQLGWIQESGASIKYTTIASRYEQRLNSVVIKAVKIRIQEKPGSDSFATVGLFFKDWRYFIKHCTSEDSDSNKLSNVPDEDNRTWILTPGVTNLTITCNKVQVLLYLYDKTRNKGCTDAFRNHKADGIKLDGADTATETIYSERK